MPNLICTCFCCCYCCFDFGFFFWLRNKNIRVDCINNSNNNKRCNIFLGKNVYCSIKSSKALLTLNQMEINRPSIQQIITRRWQLCFSYIPFMKHSLYCQVFFFSFGSNKWVFFPSFLCKQQICYSLNAHS